MEVGFMLRRTTRVIVGIVLIVSFISLAGCSGVLENKPTLTDARTEVVQDAGPVMLFNYSVNDYSDVLLQDPDGDVVNKGTLNPNKSVGGLRMGDPVEGTYKVIIQQGGETVTTKEVTFEGAHPSLTDIQADWSGNSLQQITVTVRNTGDLPVQVQNATYSARGQTVDSNYLYRWVPANSTRTITLTSSFGSSIQVTKPGDVRGTVSLETSNGTLSDSFHKTFQGANLVVKNTSPEWSGATLERVQVTVQNTGDLPTSANASITRGSDTLASSWSQELPPGETKTFDVTSLGYIYQASSGGSVHLQLLVDSPSGYVTEDLTYEFEGASLSIDSISPVWQNGELESVQVTITNTGDVAGDFDGTVTVNGRTATTGSISLDSGETQSTEFVKSRYGSDPLFVPSSGGTYDVEVTFTGPSGQTTSKTASKTLDDVQAEISGVSTTFYSNYDSDTSDLGTLNFRVQNTGSIPLSYDSITVEIDGSSRTMDTLYERSLESGASETEYLTYSSGITVSNGNHEFTIKLVNDGSIVAEHTVTVSTDS